jgi:hypothetical protein
LIRSKELDERRQLAANFVVEIRRCQYENRRAITAATAEEHRTQSVVSDAAKRTKQQRRTRTGGRMDRTVTTASARTRRRDNRINMMGKNEANDDATTLSNSSFLRSSTEKPEHKDFAAINT